MVAVLALAAVCLVPVVDADAGSDVYTNISGEDYVIKTGSDATYSIIYDGDFKQFGEKASVSIKFDAKLVNSKGETQSRGVSPSSGDLENNVNKSLTVTAPKDDGTYKLHVDFIVEITDADEGIDQDDIDDMSRSEVCIIKVVDPIKLTVDLKGDMNSNIDPSGVGVYFFVDGEKYEESYTTFTLNTNGTATVSFDLVADLSHGSHQFWVETAEGSNVMVDGLNEKHTFYVGEDSYTVWIALLVVILLIVIIAFVYVYRKPVKNYGKPKSRR